MSNMPLRAVAFTLLASLSLASNCRADETPASRNIVSLGCHDVGGTCYVTLDGPSFGSSLGCSVGATTQFRFDNGNTDEGRRAYASFLAAYLSGKRVTVDLSGCSTQGYPQLVYYYIGQ
ncbi:hypothetical protein [Dyella sp.]|uniref:hypothetical protein n=1 Tax=Dyella sp. TaxID=1869338 RepID=UPI002D79FF76|nr:hypothetical protein [Dyella sp.]HET7329842.1 hypothetical protein [Dyella sp.]